MSPPDPSPQEEEEEGARLWRGAGAEPSTRVTSDKAQTPLHGKQGHCTSKTKQKVGLQSARRVGKELQKLKLRGSKAGWVWLLLTRAQQNEQ